MRHKIYPAARHRIIEIWHYTDKNWGEKQADKYGVLLNYTLLNLRNYVIPEMNKNAQC
jgi:plasmid stabilization system protein ParE